MASARPGSPDRRPGTIQGVVLIIAALFPTMGFTTLTPTLTRMVDHFHSVPNVHLLVPAAVTLPYLALAIFSPIIGALADHFGRRRLLLAAASIYGFSGIGPFFLDNLYAILVSRFVLGISEAAVQTLALVLLGDYFTGTERRRWITLQSPIITVGVFVLTIVAGLLADVSWRTPFLIYSVTFVFFLLLQRFIWEPKNTARTNSRSTAQPEQLPSAVYGLAALTFLVNLCLIAAPIQYGFIAASRGITTPSTIGTSLAIGTLVGILLGAIAFNRLVHMPTLRIAALAVGSGAIGLTLLSIATSLIPLTLALAFENFGFGLFIPTMTGAMLSQLPETCRGRGMGVWSMSQFTGQFVSPFVTAAAVTLTGALTGAMLIFGIALAVLAVACLLWRPLAVGSPKVPNPA